MGMAMSKCGVWSLLLSIAVLSLSLFGISCSLLSDTTLFPSHNVNWRIPLSFFTVILTAAAVGNSCLRQLRSLALMILSFPICAAFFFYCMVIDGSAATARYNACDLIPATTRSTLPTCRTGLYASVVLLDFALWPLLLYAALVTYLHRKHVLLRGDLPVASSRRNLADPGRGGAGAAGAGKGGGMGGDEEREPEVNVFRQ
jgi:uncharacterized membrane protein YfcA